jgi:hypothetical protein
MQVAGLWVARRLHGGRITGQAMSPDQVLEEAVRRLKKANISRHIR